MIYIRGMKTSSFMLMRSSHELFFTFTVLVGAVLRLGGRISCLFPLLAKRVMEYSVGRGGGFFY